MAQAPDAGCALPSEPKGIPAAIDAAITKEAGGWRVTGVVVPAESATAPLLKEYLPYAGKPKSSEPARPRTNAVICALALRKIAVR